MMRGYVAGFVLVLLLVIVMNKTYRCRDNNAEVRIRMVQKPQTP